MKIVIYDTEYTTWKGALERNWSGPNEYRELVKLSAIKIEIKDNIKIIDIFDIICKPQINPILSDYFVNLTQITNMEVNTSGIFFKDALNKFLDFSTDNNNLLNCYCYGSNLGTDADILIENLNLYNINNKIIENWLNKHHYDINNFFKIYVDITKFSSGTIYKAFNIDVSKENIRVHDSLWDVKSQYLVLKYIYNNFSKEDILEFFK